MQGSVGSGGISATMLQSYDCEWIALRRRATLMISVEQEILAWCVDA